MLPFRRDRGRHLYFALSWPLGATLTTPRAPTLGCVTGELKQLGCGQAASGSCRMWIISRRVRASARTRDQYSAFTRRSIVNGAPTTCSVTGSAPESPETINPLSFASITACRIVVVSLGFALDSASDCSTGSSVMAKVTASGSLGLADALSLLANISCVRRQRPVFAPGTRKSVGCPDHRPKRSPRTSAARLPHVPEFRADRGLLESVRTSS